MTGSPLLAQWIAHLAFWALAVIGVVTENLSLRAAAIFVVLWASAYFGLPRLVEFGELFATGFVGLLDVVLVFVVFKGDVRLS